MPNIQGTVTSFNHGIDGMEGDGRKYKLRIGTRLLGFAMAKPCLIYYFEADNFQNQQ